ncbi:MAG: hypothetical protein AB7O38_26030, partial [Pirellulaceae bacterium]
RYLERTLIPILRQTRASFLSRCWDPGRKRYWRPRTRGKPEVHTSKPVGRAAARRQSTPDPNHPGTTTEQ